MEEHDTQIGVEDEENIFMEEVMVDVVRIGGDNQVQIFGNGADEKPVNDYNHNTDTDSKDGKMIDLKILADQKLLKFACDGCGKVYSTKSNLRKHISEVHLGHKLYSCGECPYQTSQKGSLVRHISSIHLREVIVCPICAKEYRWEADFRRHVTAKHTSTKFTCPEPSCGKQFTEARVLNRHKKVEHSSQKVLFKCNAKDCHFETYQQNILNVHKLHYHEELFKMCGHCDYKTFRKSDLTRHVLSYHSGTRELFKCDCIDCGIEFTRKDNLRSHQKSSHVQCDNCDYISSSKADYKKHMKEHAEPEDGPARKALLPSQVVKVKVEVDRDMTDWIVEL